MFYLSRLFCFASSYSNELGWVCSQDDMMFCSSCLSLLSMSWRCRRQPVSQSSNHVNNTLASECCNDEKVQRVLADCFWVAMFSV